MPRFLCSPVVFVVGFLLFRAAGFAVTTAGEYALYRDYGEAARATSLANLYRTRDVEYPPLAVWLGVAASAVTDALPDGVDRLTAWRPNPSRGVDGARYEVGLGVVLFAVDLACLGLVFVIARRVYPGEPVVPRLWLYTLATGALGLILYDRQDLVVGLFALAAVAAFLAERPAGCYALLTVGTAYKLVPALLLPVFVLAAASLRSGPGATSGRYLRAVVREAATAGVIFALWPLLTYLLYGERGFVYLTFHADRGLQLEAAVAWPLFVVETGTTVGHSYGSYTLRGALADRLAGWAKVAMLAAVAGGTLIAARGFWRSSKEPNPPTPFPGKEGGAGISPLSRRGRGWGVGSVVPHLIKSSLLVWLGFILANKVGSPQFLMWVGPLVPLVELRRRGERWWVGLLLVVLILTTLIFPCRYLDVRGPFLDDHTWAGPNALGLGLLAAKSVTLLTATVWLAALVWRSPVVEPDSPSEVA